MMRKVSFKLLRRLLYAGLSLVPALTDVFLSLQVSAMRHLSALLLPAFYNVFSSLFTVSVYTGAFCL